MIPNGLLLNIGILILSGGIVFSYLRPTFAEVRANQDIIAEYQAEIEKVAGINTQLQALTDQVNQISERDRARLLRYVPAEVDLIAVQRDLLLMAEEADITLDTLTVGEGVTDAPVAAVDAAATTPVSTLIPYSVSIGFTTSYEDAKSFMNLLTTNEYPLHIVELSLSGASEGGDEEEGLAVAADQVAVELTLETYALQILDSAE
jgi:hypothetical protein